MSITTAKIAEDVGAISYRWVPIGEMFRPAELQRPMDEAHVERIVNNWNDAAFGAPILSFRGHGNRGPRGEAFAIVSGQHRIEAARRVGRTRVFCAVVDGLSAADEARVFNDEDRRKRQSTLHKFHLARQSGDTTAVTIWETLNDAGFIIARDGGDKSKRTVRCIAALYRALSRGNLRATMNIIAAAFDYEAKACSAEIVDGVSVLLAARPSIDHGRLAARMRSVGAPTILQRYAMARAANGTTSKEGGTAPLTMANVLVGVYNYNLRDGKIDGIGFGETRSMLGSANGAAVTNHIRYGGMTLAEARAAAKAKAATS